MEESCANNGFSEFLFSHSPPSLNYFSYFLQLKVFAKFSRLLNSPQIFLFSIDKFLVKTNPFSHLRLGITVLTSDTVRKKSACGQLFLFFAMFLSELTCYSNQAGLIAVPGSVQGRFSISLHHPWISLRRLRAFSQCGAGGSLGCGFQAGSSLDQFIMMMFLVSTADQMLHLSAALPEGKALRRHGRREALSAQSH